MLSSPKQDKIIRSTDLDALSCRWNCVEKGYFDDPQVKKIVNAYLKYLQFCEGYTNLSAGRTYRSIFDKKLPIINRGTYLRTTSITRLMEQFIAQYNDGQIISMGGGSDTRVFHMLKANINYIELDFPETVKIKKLTIINDPELSNMVNYLGPSLSTIDNKQQFQSLDSDLHTDNYHLIGIDLRNLCNFEDAKIVQYIDCNKPTLILSECVLCYLNPEENERILNYWINKISQLSVIVYEPISLNDSFGLQMVENLSKRGINLLTINEFPTLKSKLEFYYKTLKFHNVKVTDISSIGGYDVDEFKWLNEEECKRIDKLEIIDEIEEIKLLLLHYCLIYAEIGQNFPLPMTWKLSL